MELGNLGESPEFSDLDALAGLGEAAEMYEQAELAEPTGLAGALYRDAELTELA